MNYLHLIPDSLFTRSYIELITRKFGKTDFLFINYNLSGSKKVIYKDFDNVVTVDYSKELQIIFSYMHLSDNVFLHGLSSHKIVRYLFWHKAIAKKCHWIIWGADLQFFRRKSTNLYSYLYECIRRVVIRRFKSIISYTPADIRLLKKQYNYPGDINHCFFYPGVLLMNKQAEALPYVNIKVTPRVLLGNSATRTNNHIEILDTLNKLGKGKINIICPLSYGDPIYGKAISNYGSEKFEENFKGIMNLMPLDDYFDLLNNIDIAIFDFKRQQGIGNILLVLRLGKKLYVHPNSPISELLDDYGIKYFTTDCLDKNFFSPLTELEANTNRKIIEENFSEEKSLKTWGEIFKRYK